MAFYNDEEIAKSLKSYSNGNTFSLFKLALDSLYNSRTILDDSKFIIDMFKNIGNDNDKISFLNFIIEKNIALDDLYTETNTEDLEKFNEYWKNSIEQPAPLLFFIIPYLQDEDLVKIFEEGKLYELSYLPNNKNLAENLVIKLFEKGQYKSLISLKENHRYFIDKISFYDTKIYPGQTEEKYFSDVLISFIEEEPKLLIAYGKFQSYSFIDKSEQWLTNQLDKERRNHILLQDFFDNVFPELPEMGKELIVARTLYRTNNLDYTMMALNKMGITDISDYKPNDYPLWLYAHDHQNKSIYRKLLRSNVDLFAHYAPSNKTFFTTILDGPGYKETLDDFLNEQKIEKKDFIKKLFEKHIDKDGIEYFNYSLVSGCGDTRTLKIINLQFNDLILYKKKFAPEKFNSLTIKEQLNLLNDVMDRTMLAPTYIYNSHLNNYAKESLKKKVINFNIFTENLSNNMLSSDILEKHLELLVQVDPNICDYRHKYFEIALKMFQRYDFGYLNKSQDIYRIFVKIVDYIATDKNLDWKSLNEGLISDYVVNKKPNFSEGAMEIYNYLDKVCLSHELTKSSAIEKKKLKI